MAATPEWLEQIKVKAKTNNVSLQEQMTLNAGWLLDQERKKGNVNNRWKRNPRVGIYEFMLVACAEEEFNRLPIYVKDLSVKDTVIKEFVNPFYYFKNQVRDKKIFVAEAKKTLKTKATLKPDNGVYIDLYESPNPELNLSSMNSTCGNSDDLFYKANYQQFFIASIKITR